MLSLLLDIEKKVEEEKRETGRELKP